MFWKHRPQPRRLDPPEHFPREFWDIWLATEEVDAIRREAAALLLADLRATGPAWPAERFECLRGILNDLARGG